MEAVGIGDLHLPDHLNQGGLARYLNSPEKYVCHEVRRVLSWAERRGISNILLYGDICHNTRMNYESQLEISKLFRDHPDFTFYIIPGNHDVIGRSPDMGHSLELLTAFNMESHVKYIFEPTTFTIDNVPVRFLPFPYSDFSPKALNVCHLDVYGAVADSGRQILNKERDSSNNVIVAGHIHTNQRVRNTYYSGTLYQTCFGERLPKFFHHIEFNSPKDYEIRDVGFNPRIKLHTVTATKPEDLPRDLDKKRDLIKLVVPADSKLAPHDYAHLNVVQFRTFQSKKTLASVLTEDLPTNGKGLKLSTKEFFETWVSGVDVPDKLKSQASAIRRRVLASVR